MDKEKRVARSLCTLVALLLIISGALLIPWFYERYLAMGQCNEIGRKLAAEYEGRLTFVDLDSLMTGRDNSLFIDLAHMSEKGKEVKSQHVADAILRSLTHHKGAER